MKNNLHLTYDELDIIEQDVKYNRESGEFGDKTDQELFDMASEDNDIFRIEWEYVIDEMTNHLENKTGYFHIYSNSMGWDNRSGYKYFFAEDGETFFREVLPDCELTMNIKSHYKGYKMRLSHHDRPMGETYIIKPISEKEYLNNT